MDVVDQVISEQFTQLTTRQQDEFWTEIHGYALAQTREKGRASLIAAPQLGESVRRALQVTDEHISTELEMLNAQDQHRFWEVLHESAQRALEESGMGAK